MVKKSALLKKLSSYSALASVAIGASTKADGQVVYHDIIPNDTVFMHGNYLLDLNGDGTNDFKLTVTTFVDSTNLQYYIAGIYASHGDDEERDTDKALPTDVAFARPNTFKDTIDVADTWSSVLAFDFCSLKNFKNEGVFAGKGDKYVGLKLISGGDTYYGWVRVNLNAKCDTLIIRDYAYNATAGALITAGEGDTLSAGIAQLTESAMLEPSSPNPASTISNIIYTIPVYSYVSINLYDLMGRKIETVLDNAMQEPGRHRIPVDVSRLSSGVYFYELTVNGQTYTQKIAVTH